MIRLYSRTKTIALIIEETYEGFFLYSYPKDGAIAGDTWHLTLDDAKHQAQFQFAISDWADVPEAVTDLHAFGRQ
jgi:hypothetical protein